MSEGDVDGGAVEAGAPEGGAEGGQEAGQAEQSAEQVNPWAVDGGVVKIKGAGKEHEFKSLAELQKAAQYGLGAQKAFEEAAVLRKAQQEWEQERNGIAERLNQFFASAKQNPEALLRELGIDPMEYSEKSLKKHLDYQAMTPEQRAEKARLEQLEKEAEELRGYKNKTEQEKAEAEAKRQEEAKRAQDEADMKELTSEINAELDKDEFLGAADVRPEIVIEACNVMVNAASQTPPIYLTPEQAVGYVRADMEAKLIRRFKALNPEVVISKLGEDWARGVREYDLNRAKKVVKEVPAKGGKQVDKKFGSLREMIAAGGA
jgi:hypothetical protein